MWRNCTSLWKIVNKLTGNKKRQQATLVLPIVKLNIVTICSVNFKNRDIPIKKTRNRMRTIILTISFIFSLTHIFGQTEDAKLKISHLTGDFYIYTTYNTYEESQVPANGMYLVTNNGVVLFDTPWDTTQFQPLLDSIKLRHNKSVVICISTHWHSDRTAGLEYYKQQGIKTYTTVLTDELSKKNDKKRAEFLIAKDTVFNIEPTLLKLITQEKDTQQTIL